MMRAMLIFELRKTFLVYALSLLVLFGYILFRSSPHGFFDWVLVLMAIAHGGVIGGRIFYDNNRTQAFIFSLPFTKRRLFLYRFISGILLISISILIVLVLLASGMRNVLQQDLGSPYFPYVMWYELRVLFPFMFYTFLGFTFGMFSMIEAQLLKSNGVFNNHSKLYFSSISISVNIYYFYFFMIYWLNITSGLYDIIHVSLVFAISLFSVCICFYSYQHLEIDS
jgi:ABC-2 family transporter